MANNSTLTASIIAKEALVILDNRFAWMKKYLHRGHESEFDKKINGYKVGSSVTIRRPAAFSVRTGSVMNVQDVVEGGVQLSVDRVIGVDFEFDSTELTLSIDELSERVMRPAMSGMMNELGRDIADVMYKGFYNWVGTPGQIINSYADFGVGAQRLDEMLVPEEDRCCLLSPADQWGMLGSQTGLYVSDAARSAYRDAELGRIGGVDTFMSQLVATHVVGPQGGTPLINGASQTRTYGKDPATASNNVNGVANSGTLVKDAWSQTLVTDGWTAAAALRLRAGDVFTIANVFMVNPRTKVTTGILQQFVVLADGSSDASGNLTLTISPPIITSGPQQTVTAAPADNAAITVVGSAGSAHRQNMMFHKNSTALAVVPMEMPAGAVNPARESYQGWSVRVIPVYDGTNDVSKWRLDMLYGRRVIDPRLGTRASGTA